MQVHCRGTIPALTADMQVPISFLLPMAFLLPPGTRAGQIFGGREAEPHSRPYMAYLKRKFEGENTFCGGFLVAENFVLTAAHCQADKIMVVLGAHNIHQSEDSQQLIPVQSSYPHENYDEESLNNDIMLLQLQENVKPTGWVGLLPVPSAHERVEPGSLCTVAGWGSLVPDAPLLPDKLQEVDVVVMPDAACPRNPHWLYRHYDPATMICVGDPARFYNAAKGDSGGPLVCGGTAQGIVSWGPDKAPAVYTKLSVFTPWIQDTVRSLQPGARL
ncbi:mast cell protease 1A-like [Pelodiscus sinensis]|uniref:mast cell protease 1A-like n=1 Tax=Pelodiscus sinensis TaxID=13735 RepID=UPI003F6A88AC